MDILSGTLDGMGLAPLVAFLTSLKKTGSLAISQGEWEGAIRLHEGVVVNASLGPDRGLAALEAVALALGRARFTFSEEKEDLVRQEVNIVLTPTELQTRLTELHQEATALATIIPSLSATAHVAPMAWGADDEITLTRSTLLLFGSLDGGRRVEELARDHGITKVLRDLADLVHAGLIVVDAPPAEERVRALPQPSKALPDPSQTNGKAESNGKAASAGGEGWLFRRRAARSATAAEQ